MFVNKIREMASIYKHDAIDIADPSGIQDEYHMNFVNRTPSLLICLQT